MSEVFEGTLSFKGEGKNRRRFLNYTSRKGKPMSEPISPDKLATSLRGSSESEIAVSFELDASGRPIQVRERCESWTEAVPSSTTRATQSAISPGSVKTRRMGDFHNPYNFIPAPPRPKTGTDLDDASSEDLMAHDHYEANKWTGRIAVRLTTSTPLLIMDTARTSVDKKDHKTFHLRLDSTGNPYIAPTSIKGMLRTAYEAVTNSRMGVFHKHHERLAYRMAARIGPVPARVERQPDNTLALRIMRGSGVVDIGFAAKLPRYKDEKRFPRDVLDKGEKQEALPFPDGGLPQHGDRVWVQVERSRCTHIQLRTNDTSPPGRWHRGWVCITGPNINRKRYERVFIEGRDGAPIPITRRHEELWRELILNYQETHKRELRSRKKKGFERQDYLGDKPGETGWSRHIDPDEKDKVEINETTDNRSNTGVKEFDMHTLHEGTLCYVEFAQGSTTEVTALIPVTISRRLYEFSPEVLLPESLKPARRFEELSPADRVFGWVNQKGLGAFRGKLRVGIVTCVSTDPLEPFSEVGVPLAILGQPKPQQTRFYVAGSPQNEAQEDGISREQAGYWPHKGLRGRKVYPHHAQLPHGYWANPEEDRTQKSLGGFFQEYRRPHKPVIESRFAQLDDAKVGFKQTNEEQRDDQNRSVTGWVKEQTQFEFELSVINLSRVELGALLWLLELPADHHHKLGGGKPLGFGSVTLTIDWNRTDLRQGKTLKRRYGTLGETSNDDSKAAQSCIDDFKNAVARSYSSGEFERASFIAAFRRYARGFNKPVHYPRALQLGQRRNGSIPPHPEGKAFEWFVANERTGKFGGPKLALPDLLSDDGLPILETR